jgi:hypothetical protein
LAENECFAFPPDMLNRGNGTMSRKGGIAVAEPDRNFYGVGEDAIPTPKDQQDVSALDMVSEVVEELSETVQDALGLQDEPHGQTGGEARR